MKASAIICEYNPFHNGHKFQIDSARSLTGCDAVIALMSGNFVQRGDFALFPKNIRAKAALGSGVDLILENPSVFVLRSAEGYASSAVYTLSALGCVDYLVFGTECDNLDLLKKIASVLATESTEFKMLLARELSGGSSFAQARSRAIGHLLGSDAENVLKQPNNLLAIEYIKAIIRQNSSIEPVLIKRTGAGHNSSSPEGSIASASFIRDEFIKNRSNAFRFVPDYAAEYYSKSKFFVPGCADKSMLASVCLSKKEVLAHAPDISEGLENKIKTEAMRQNSISSLIEAVKSKRYAYSRLRRSLLCSYLGITADDSAAVPEYIKILDFNKTGQAVLNIAKKSTALPLAKSASPLLGNNRAMKLWKRELEYDRIYEIFTKL